MNTNSNALSMIEKLKSMIATNGLLLGAAGLPMDTTSMLGIGADPCNNANGSTIGINDSMSTMQQQNHHSVGTTPPLNNSNETRNNNNATPPFTGISPGIGVVSHHPWPNASGNKVNEVISHRNCLKIHQVYCIACWLQEAFCEICRKELCNKYFLRTHLAKKHGITVDDVEFGITRREKRHLSVTGNTSTNAAVNSITENGLKIEDAGAMTTNLWSNNNNSGSVTLPTVLGPNLTQSTIGDAITQVSTVYTLCYCAGFLFK